MCVRVCMSVRVYTECSLWMCMSLFVCMWACGSPWSLPSFKANYSNSFFSSFVWWCFIALVVICGSWWWNVYAVVLDSWKVSYINGILPDPSRVFSQAGCTISHHFCFLFLNESSTPFIKTLVSNDIASQDNLKTSVC